MPNQNQSIVRVAISDLNPAHYNPRKWSEEATKQLTESIQKFGLVDPILANSAKNRKNVVIGGHFRLKVAKNLGYKTVPVLYVDIPDENREREYMLHLVPDDDRIIERGMIHYYDELPVALQGQYNDLIIGVDLAISESNKADYTTMIPLSILGRGDEQRIYVMPNITNKRMSFPDTIDRLRELNRFYCYPKFYIEQTAYQAAVVQQLKTEGLDVIGVSPHSDKRSRLNMIADKIQRGVILFSRTGVEDLITQLVGFGIEKHDDLVDALTTAVLTFAISESETSYVRVGTWEDAGISNPFRRTIAPRGRDYWNRRLDDWNEATSGFWD